MNPWPWSLEIGFNQAEIVEGKSRELICAGRTAMSAEGVPQHPDDMAAQLGLALGNLEAVLHAAEMTLANVVRLNYYTTDVDSLIGSYAIVAERLSAAGVRPPAPSSGLPAWRSQS